MLGALIVAFVAVLTIPSGLLAQEADEARLAGRLVGSESGEPVDGALVRLLDAESRPIRATLSDDEGRFGFGQLTPGRYRVRVVRLGYGPWTSEAFSLEAGGRRSRTFHLPVRPVELPELRAMGEGVCPTDPASARRALDLYLEVRPSLEAIAETEKSGRYHFVVEVVQETRDEFDRRSPLRRDSTVVRVPRPLATLSPGELLREGYARPDTSRSTYGTYYAPDAEALASEEFLLSHCLEMAGSDDGEGLGIRFSPLPDRVVVDIRGVLWLEPETRRPTSVEYEYTRIREFMREYALPWLQALYENKFRDRPEVRVNYSAIQANAGEDIGGRVDFRDVRPGVRITVVWRQEIPVLVHSGWFGADIGANVYPEVKGYEKSARILALVPVEQ